MRGQVQRILLPVSPGVEGMCGGGGGYVDGGDAVLTISYPVIVPYLTVFYRAHSVTWTSMSAVSTRALTWAVRMGPRASTPRGASRESPCMQRKCICKIL